MVVSCFTVFTRLLNYFSIHILPQIHQLTLIRLTLSPEASRLCGKAVSSMTKLKSLDLCDMTFNDGFFQVLSESTSTSMVRTVSMFLHAYKHTNTNTRKKNA